MADGRWLAGFHIKASGATKGFVLVAHGNAMLAEQIVPAFMALNSPNLDIVLYDDRGYGRSEGAARFLAMFSDARALFDSLRDEIGGAGFGYGISQGGIILANALLAGAAGVSGVVIDGSPGDLPWYLCSSGFDPAERVAAAAIPGAAIMVVSGGSDQVVSRAWMSRLISATEARGGTVVLKDHYPHPFQEPSEGLLMERLNAVWAFFERRRS
jgi:alpha-beta hydrolase superfamily lysophospholipase